MAEDTYRRSSWRFYFTLGAVFGVAAYGWFAVQGEYAFGLTMFVMSVTVLPPLWRFKDWLYRDRATWGRRGEAWAERHPAASKRLRWVVFPIIGLVWAGILWVLFSPLFR